MFGIVVALYSEAEGLLSKLNNVKEICLADKKAFLSSLNNHQVILAISGIGKVSAALTTQLIIDKYSPDFILNFGTAGGMNKSVNILEYYAIDKCCQFDFDLRELDGVPLGYIQEYDKAYFPTNSNELVSIKKTNLATADRFTNDENDIQTINQIGCSVRDMEGAAIAQVCTSNGVKLYMIKGISDVYGNGTAQEQFYHNLKQVGAGFPEVIFNVVKEIYKK